MQVNVSQRELPALLGIFKGNMVEIHASVCHLLLTIFRGSQGAFVGQHLRDTLCALRCHGGHDEYHGEHHHRYQNLHAVGDQGRQLSGGQLSRSSVDDDPRAKVIHQEHGQIHAEHHGRVIESQDLLNKGKVLAHLFSGLVKLLRLIGLTDKRLYHTDAGHILLYRVI